MAFPWMNTVSLSLLATATILISGWSDRAETIPSLPADLPLVLTNHTPSLELATAVPMHLQSTSRANS
jgi:hypothetical protein